MERKISPTVWRHEACRGTSNSDSSGTFHFNRILDHECERVGNHQRCIIQTLIRFNLRRVKREMSTWCN